MKGGTGRVTVAGRCPSNGGSRVHLAAEPDGRMARMIPRRPAPETPDSERRVYEQFHCTLPATWTVIHSQRFLLPASRRVQEGELDFLLLDPSRGALGLEVKGGRVERTPAGWFSLDRYGQKHAIKDPGRQASSSIHAIGRYWKEAPGFGGRGFRCGFCWGVVLPDIESPSDMGPDLPRTVIVDREDVAPDEIAIVSTRTLKNSPFAHDRRAGRFELVTLDDRERRSSTPSPASRVVFETLYRFKGLERDVVILLDLPGSHVTDKHRYVAASRARHLLAVVSLA